MKTMDNHSQLVADCGQSADDFNNRLLDVGEIRLITDGDLERLADFAASSRLHATDANGDTPLHLAARSGKLALCDLFVRLGASPRSLNRERQTPADVAFAEGHGLAAQLLSSLTARSSETIDECEDVSEVESARIGSDMVPEHHFMAVQETERGGERDDLDDALRFEAEAEPEEFFCQHTGETASGTFVALVSSAPAVSVDEDGDWDLDLSPAQIAGEGIGSISAVAIDHGVENDFLKVRNRGRQSVKRAIVQTGTRLSIDPEICISWAEEILAKGWCSFDDVDRLVTHCEGNGDFKELHANLHRHLEAAGFCLEGANGHDAGLWDAPSDVSSDDLAEAIEAALTRATRLPGTQRFVMDKPNELQFVEPMIRAKQELQLGILASETAVETILHVVDLIRDGSRDPSSVSLRPIIPSHPSHAATAEVMAAAEALKSWHANGRMMDGKRRREALAALEALDLSLAFYKELVLGLEQDPACQAQAIQLGTEILAFESATENLIREHLPYARRFASRNVKEGEDPEDVFQVAFMGLQRSTRRFDPERRYRFVIYATYWMRQAITRWRSDEGSAIRIPAHRHEKIDKLDRALDKLGVRFDVAISDDELAVELEWTADEVRQFRGIPREVEYPESIDDWDGLLPASEQEDVVDQRETEKVVADALAELQERQADVIRKRFGVGYDAEMTLEEVGQLYGVTRERIRQIEAKGLDRLSHPGRKRRLQELLGI